jgi:hypothetical protein
MTGNRKQSLLVRLMVVVALLGAFAFGGTASAASTKSGPSNPNCVVTTSPGSFVETGLGSTASSIALIVTVECKPVYAEYPVNINALQLSNACAGTLSAYQPSYPSGAQTGSQFTAWLDNDGNANLVIWGGPSCSASRDLITASLIYAPYTTASTYFTVSPPVNTKPGVYAYPASLVEDSVYSAVATIFYVEAHSVNSEYPVTIKSDELYDRCGGLLTWVGPEETILATDSPEATVYLDNNGNAFVVAIGGPSCASGRSHVQADLVYAPYTTYTTTFNILSPRVTHN